MINRGLPALVQRKRDLKYNWYNLVAGNTNYSTFVSKMYDSSPDFEGKDEYFNALLNKLLKGE